jgi:hypothetical protein
MHPDRWEIGSHFHWSGLFAPGEAPLVPWSTGSLVSSGRDALRMTLAVGARAHGWRHLWVPDYFCQQVVAALAQTGLELRVYPDNPLRRVPDLPDARPGDAILVMNYFGLREGFGALRRDGVGLIEDHSHDPTSAWAFTSGVDFCVASLRKTIPLPDGGVVWSPLGHELPPEPREGAQRQRTAATRLQAMILKAMYLDGHPVKKADFRAIADRAERDLAVPSVSAMNALSRGVLASFPIDLWRRRRAANHAALVEALAGLGWGQVLGPVGRGGAPFSAALIVDTPERRERVRTRLVDARIYPAVLWPLESPVVAVGDEARTFSRRMLSIPCDARYETADMRRIAEVLRSTDRDRRMRRPPGVA